jgi:2-keto-4-pentenoate hydratase/2-oxohepta-3-ene-1,7-dioic acid hydratase in catechol pathway
VLVTADALSPDGLEVVVRVDGDARERGRVEEFDWVSARDLAGAGTTLRPGDLIAGPALGLVGDLAPGTRVEIDVEGLGVLEQSVVA